MTRQRLAALIAAVTVDCYNEAERATAFYTVLTDEVRLPATASLLGTTITVAEIDIGDDGESLLARCVNKETERWLALADVEFPQDTPAAWLHAAYRQDRGLTPYAFTMPAGWVPDWL